MLTDAIIDRHGRDVPNEDLCGILNRICIPLAGSRMADLLKSSSGSIMGAAPPMPAPTFLDVDGHAEEIMIELELCISLIFKPFLHHLRTLLEMRRSGEFVSIWTSMLGVMTQLLGEAGRGAEDGDTTTPPSSSSSSPIGFRTMTRDNLLLTTKELGSEHLRNAILVLVASGVLHGDGEEKEEAHDGSTADQTISGGGYVGVTALTWNAIDKMRFCRRYAAEWKEYASSGGREGEESAETAEIMEVGSRTDAAPSEGSTPPVGRGSN